MLIGFETLKSKLLNSYHSQKLPHATLLNGKRGIGKASFAKEICEEILNGKNIANPDILFIQKEEGKRDITVDKVRKIAKFVNQTSSSGKDKFIIIDSACELNKSAANGILKILEEPHPNNFLILISHNLNRVLPTIRSRCHITTIKDHSFENFSKIIEQEKTQFSAEEIKFLANIFDNSPAQVINLGAETSRFYQLFLRSILNKKISNELIKKISDKNFPFAIFERIIEFFFSRLIKNSASLESEFFFEEKEVITALSCKFSTKELFQISDEIMATLHKTPLLYLDRKLCLINIFNHICYE